MPNELGVQGGAQGVEFKDEWHMLTFDMTSKMFPRGS